jgi:hypothetical protein
MPAEIIDRVHTLARRQAAAPGLLFTNRDGTPLVDHESYQPDNDPDDNEDLLDDDIDGPIAGVYANNEHKEGKEEQPIEDEDNEYEQPIEDEDEEEQPIKTKTKKNNRLTKNSQSNN